MIKTMFMQFVTENVVTLTDSYYGSRASEYVLINDIYTMVIVIDSCFENYSLPDLINLIQKDIIKILSIKFY